MNNITNWVQIVGIVALVGLSIAFIICSIFASSDVFNVGDLLSIAFAGAIGLTCMGYIRENKRDSK